MQVQFTNPQGRMNTANLTSEQVEILNNLEGYKVVEKDSFDFDLPEVPKVRIHRREFEECLACSA